MADTVKQKELTEKEIAKRRDETLKHMLKTPPKPHSKIAGNPKKNKPKRRGVS